MYHILINSKSKSNKSIKIWHQIELELNKREIEYQAYFTDYKNHATDIISSISTNNKENKIIILGGDGTLNEVINGIKDFEHTSIGYIPTGSSNDFARGMKISKDYLITLDKILHSNTIKEIDLGYFKYQDKARLFIGSSGIGFDASVCYKADQSKIKPFLNSIKLGKLIYVIIAIKTLLSFKLAKIDLEIDQKRTTFEKVYFACILNNKFEGGGFKFTPDALINDQQLDLCLVEGRNKFIILCLLPTAFFGKHINIKGVHILKGKEFKIKSTPYLYTHVDGEICGKQNDINISLYHKKLKLIQ